MLGTSDERLSVHQENRVKSISAAIVVMTGIACFYIASVFPRHESTGNFVMVAGAVIAGCGLIGWFRTLGNPP